MVVVVVVVVVVFVAAINRNLYGMHGLRDNLMVEHFVVGREFDSKRPQPTGSIGRNAPCHHQPDAPLGSFFKVGGHVL